MLFDESIDRYDEWSTHLEANYYSSILEEEKSMYTETLLLIY